MMNGVNTHPKKNHFFGTFSKLNPKSLELRVTEFGLPPVFF